MSVPSLEEQKRFYDDWNERWRSARFEEIENESRARGAKVLELVRSLPFSRPRILEVGCGTGWLTEKLSDYGAVLGVDLSGKAIEIAKARGSGADFIAGDFFSCELATDHYDLVICLETIFYVEDQLSFMKKIASLSKPKGWLILTSLNKFVYDRRSDIGLPEPGQIRKWLTRKDLKNLIATEFGIVNITTLLPKGDLGILRIINSHKLNRVFSTVMGEMRIKRIKEKLGFGHTIVVLAQRR